MIFEDIRDLLDRQFDRLSRAEQQVMIWLAIDRDSQDVRQGCFSINREELG
ncbi:MAG: hypothetical protein F6K28_55940 [Microcoleus sp. SIO2G3]|nr:hypothetical protein [Microcoleus sp. SIO2G3]